MWAEPLAEKEKRWGRKLLRGDEIGHAWFAREDFEVGVPVVFAPAPSVEAAMKIGAVLFKDCPECEDRALMRSDDYICINCRRDEFLDEIPRPQPNPECPDCEGTGTWHECGSTQTCRCVDYPF